MESGFGSGQSPGEELEKERGTAEAATNLDSLREILFGVAFRAIEQRLGRIEVHLAARAEELQQEVRRRAEMVEGHVRRETEALTSRLERAHASQAEAMSVSTRETRETIASIESRLTRLETGLAQAQRDSRKQLHDQALSFIDELHRVRGDLTSTIERELALSRGEEPAARTLSGDGHDREAGEAEPGR
jgi:hypothetical protein